MPADDELEPLTDEVAPSAAARRPNIFVTVIAVVATLCLATIAVTLVRIERQGERQDCVERAQALGAFEQLNEPDGRSSQRLFAQRHAACFGLTETPPVEPIVLGTVDRRCPNNLHSFEQPPLDDETGDGLPRSGDSTRAKAQRIAARRPQSETPRIVAIDGRAWHTEGDSVVIEPELIYAVEVTVPSKSDCPLGPVVDGVPVLFFYKLD